MIFVSLDDFNQKTASMQRLSREEERAYALRLRDGDTQARQALIESYLPFVAGYVKRYPLHLRTLGLVLYCVHATEKAVDSFNFLQDSETFLHHLNRYLRNAAASYLVR